MWQLTTCAQQHADTGDSSIKENKDCITCRGELLGWPREQREPMLYDLHSSNVGTAQASQTVGGCLVNILHERDT